ncbi:hypothetical protein [Streptomyces sp. A012304]|uniref:hypothetical protein n=1 Tax=Streptomyces sp. A012304 TaxID=375446 RepID=UPI0022314F5E|nr:hypothetical protein [Streptomyces sp. A012304]GKQ34318.1 hypothetical protein ALMP_08690 [Streptomyces sp. A012304]
MSATEPKVEVQPRPFVLAGVSMRDLLASCAAADAVSRPPRAPESPAAVEQRVRRRRHREAA